MLSPHPRIAGVVLIVAIALVANTGLVFASADPAAAPGSPVAHPFDPANTSGAKCNGVTNDTPAIQAAVDTAGQRPDGVVSIPAGTCALFGHVHLDGRYGVTVEGAGPTLTFLVQHSDSNIFEITTPGSTVKDLNLNTVTFNPGLVPSALLPVSGVLYSSASDTTVSNITAETGSGFGMRLTGPNPCAAYPTSGNAISNIDMVSHGTAGYAALDIDCQRNADVTNITIQGGILALYMDANVVLDGEVYHGVQRCQPAWFVTGPANHILIENVLTYGGAGRIHGAVTAIAVSGQTSGPDDHC